ncbi:MAG: arylsulfatase [Verrucomicrobiota bacterium]
MTKPCWMLSVALIGGLLMNPSGVEGASPNVIVILVDDMGWGDAQCYQSDSKIPTPHLDALAASGVRFTDAHTPSSVCTPTRYALLTGRYPWRTWLEKGVLDGFGPPLISSDEATLATMLREKGYATACVGKWHLGMDWYDVDGNPMGVRGEGGFRPGENVDFEREITGGPNDVGFDRYFGISASLDMSPYLYLRDRKVETMPTEWHEQIQDTIFLNGVSGVKSPGFDVHDVLGRFGDEAVAEIESHADGEKPFFLYLPLNSPHLPVAPADHARGKSEAGEYGDFMWETDEVVGRVMEALERTGQRDNTLLIFTSDNGGLWHYWDFPAADDGGRSGVKARGNYVREFEHQSNADWRGTKADIFEGGHRVPFIVSWPAKIEGGRVSDALVEVTDVFATVAEVVGAEARRGTSGMDSVSFLAVLTREGEAKRSFAVHHSLGGMFAIRRGDWKLIEGRGSGGFTRPNFIAPKEGEPPGQLYHLGDDPQERENVWQKNGETVEQLQDLLDRIRVSSATEAR